VVVPILRESAPHRQYVTLPEAGANVDIHDTGNINRFSVKNHTEENLFIRFGTIFKGDTQERALVRSAVVFAGSKAEVEVRCVHASKGIHRGAKNVHAGYTPLEMDQVLYGSCFSTSSQSEYWSTVHRVSSTMVSSRLHTPTDSMSSIRESSGFLNDMVEEPVLRDRHFSYTDDLAANMEVFSKNFDDVIRSIEMKENQAGFALITPAGVETIETFDSPLSWKAIHTDAVRRVGQKLVNQEDLSAFEFKPERAKQAIRSVLSKPWKEKPIWEHKPNNGDPHVLITGLSADGYTGEVVEVDHRVIHLALVRMN
jgi:hypothetical protein